MFLLIDRPEVEYSDDSSEDVEVTQYVTHHCSVIEFMLTLIQLFMFQRNRVRVGLINQ